MRSVGVTGVGLWTPRLPGAAAFFDDREDPEATRPGAPLLDGALRRRATPLTRMGIEVMHQATSMAATELSTLPSVWATDNGEHSVAIDLLGMMLRGEGKLSPTKFHHSVHNTASGYASIATGNRSPSTTLTGGSELVVSALLEAVCMIDLLERDVLLVLADEPLLPPFARDEVCTPLALALVLSPDTGNAIAELGSVRREAPAPVARHPRFGSMHVSAALPLFDRIVTGRPGPVALELEGYAEGPFWCVDVEPLRRYPGDP